TNEPYRMFTSRAEYRLLLREDNADLRLTEIGQQLGLIGAEQWQAFITKKMAINEEKQRLSKLLARPSEATKFAFTSISREVNYLELLGRPEVTYKHLFPSTDLPEDVTQQIEIQQKYSGYIKRQQTEISRLRRYENTLFPETIDYNQVSGLSNEVRQKLAEYRPTTVGQASRISGITPAAISLLLIHLKNRYRNS
ncbi:MAG: tRNA uridine-5-carboxymethylaminomethyl(34) synthesis enzyme MnmG, partial [Candidatus Marithrix sp.]|nr:tRNA uridine-5-carboxymethylaminomethyl(34) synthesis enzyme MnmG [Candidatus Marithrix sp.]